jgi:hypothetical protein
MGRGRYISVPAALLLAAALAGPAQAGGWWTSIRIDGPYVGVGETLTVGANPMFGTIAAAGQAHRSGGFHAYLLQGVDEEMVSEAMSVAEPGDWWTPPPVRHLVGTVRLSRPDANLATATAEVTIPDVPPGRYSLMLCTSECADPLADVVPADVVVSGDAALAGTARRLDAAHRRLRSKAIRAGHRLEGARDRLDDVRDDLEAESEAAGYLEEKVDELTAALAARSGEGRGFGAGAAWGFAGGLLAAAFVRLGSRLRSSRADGRPGPARAHPWRRGRRRRRPRTTPGPA